MNFASLWNLKIYLQNQLVVSVQHSFW